MIKDFSAAAMCLNVFGCVIEPSSSIYLSTPVTTGRLFYQWVKGGGDPHSCPQSVISANTKLARLTTLRLRDVTRRNIINPAVFYQEGWTQQMYLSFWVDVIRKFAAEVWLNEGWEYSNGCTCEYYAAYQAGIPCFTLDGQQVEMKHAIELISKALNDMTLANMDTKNIELTLKSMWLYRK